MAETEKGARQRCTCCGMPDSEFTKEGECFPCHEGEHLDHCTKGNDTSKAGDAPTLGTPPTGTDPDKDA